MTDEEKEEMRKIVREELSRQPLACEHAWIDYGYAFNHEVMCLKCHKITKRNDYPGFRG